MFGSSEHTSPGGPQGMEPGFRDRLCGLGERPQAAIQTLWVDVAGSAKGDGSLCSHGNQEAVS